MTEKKKVQAAIVNFGKNNQDQFTFENIGKAALEKAIEWHNNQTGKKLVKTNFEAKMLWGSIFLEVADKERNTTKRGQIFAKICPNFSPQERSNFQVMARFQKEDSSFTNWKNANFPRLNSETAINQHWRDFKAAKQAVQTDQFKSWNETNSNPLPTKTYKQIMAADTAYKHFKEEVEKKKDKAQQEGETTTNQDGEPTSSAGGNKLMEPAEFMEKFIFIVNQGSQLANKDKFDDKQKAEIFRYLESFTDRLFAEAEAKTGTNG